MSCEKCADNRLNMRVEPLRLAVEGASISHKIDFEDVANRYFTWLTQANKIPQKKSAKKELT